MGAVLVLDTWENGKIVDILKELPRAGISEHLKRMERRSFPRVWRTMVKNSTPGLPYSLSIYLEDLLRAGVEGVPQSSLPHRENPAVGRNTMPAASRFQSSRPAQPAPVPGTRPLLTDPGPPQKQAPVSIDDINAELASVAEETPYPGDIGDIMGYAGSRIVSIPPHTKVPAPASQPKASVAPLGIESPGARKESGSIQEKLIGMAKRQFGMPKEFAQVVPKIVPDLDPADRGALLNELAAVVSKCAQCPQLASSRTQTVFGVGNPNAELVFVGEGPGADEDAQGIPFVGRSGKLLTDIITKGMKMNREDVYICNIVRCRPPGNRNPTPEEAACCSPFLEATLNVIRPKFICCLGAVAVSNLLKTTENIGKLRGKLVPYSNGLVDAQVVCTYHPAYLLRNPPSKAQAWEDIKLLLRAMGRM